MRFLFKLLPLILIAELGAAQWMQAPNLAGEIEPSAAERQAGVVMRRIDAIPGRRVPFRFPAGAEARCRVRVTPGDYVPVYLAVASLNDTPVAVPECPALPGCRLEIWENEGASDSGSQLENAAFLTIPATGEDGSGATLRFFTVKVHADADAAPGVRNGNLLLRSGTGEILLPLQVKVETFRLPEIADDAGFYLPGHFFRESEGVYVNYAPELYRAERLREYFDFWRSLRLNSPVLYHNYPGLAWRGGRLETDFSEMSRFALTMREAGLNGHLVLELRHITWFCQRIAEEKAAGTNPDGLTGKDGRNSKQYLPEAKRLFGEILRRLLVQAEEEKWPPLLIITEEEVSNDPWKLAGYEDFVPVLQEICPERMLVVDNSIGYGNPEAVDRGKRDRVPFRQYNSWTPEALVDAQKDGAVVMSFNYGATRAAYGISQLRLGAKGHHQWADQWVDSAGAPGSQQWCYARITGTGVESSDVLESVHEGRLDLAAARLLEQLVERLKKGGFSRAAASAQTALERIAADVPENGMQFRSWQPGVSNRDLDLRRWELFDAIDAARKVLASKRQEGESAVSRPPAWRFELLRDSGPVAVSGSGSEMALYRAGRPMKLDGVCDEAAYGEGTPRFDHMPGRSREIRAKCSSLEEYESKLPSSTRVALAYDEKGLYLFWSLDNWDASGRYRAQTENNTWEIWNDDALLSWFQNPENQQLSLIVENTLGKQTFTADNERIPEPGIRRVVRENGSGGATIEEFVPWRALGVEQMPKPGSRWRANFYRTMPTLKEECQWTRAEHQFYDQAQWGTLVFSGQMPRGIFADWNLPVPVPGRNRISGRLPQEFGDDQTVRLIGPDGKTAAEASGAAGASVALPWQVGQSLVGSQFQLQLLDAAGSVREETVLTVESPEPALRVLESPRAAISGDEVELTVELRFPNARSGVALNGSWRSGNARVSCPALPVENTGIYRLCLPTAGLGCGERELRLTLTPENESVVVPIRLLSNWEDNNKNN